MAATEATKKSKSKQSSELRAAHLVKYTTIPMRVVHYFQGDCVSVDQLNFSFQSSPPKEIESFVLSLSLSRCLRMSFANQKE